MSIYRVKKNKDNPYVIINKSFLDDATLSLKAKGLLAYLLSKPDNWKIYQSYVEKTCTNGRDSIYSGITELVDAGYIKKGTKRSDDGKFASTDYDVFEVKEQDKQDVISSVKEPLTENPDADNPTLLINDSKKEEDNDYKKRCVNDFLKEKTYRYPDWLLQKKAEAEVGVLIIYFYNKESIQKCVLYKGYLESDAGMPVTFKES